jgi:hypothetical protein
MSDLKHQLTVYRHYVVSWATLNEQSLYLLLKLVIFLAKVVSLTKPCLPVMPKEAIWWPLMGLAAMELALGNKVAWKGMALFAMLHVVTLGLAVRFGRGMCAERGFERWDLGDD